MRFQILSLDGGGIKGAYAAAILANLEENLGDNVMDHFDLITGTSTGGIIALCLASGKRPKEVVDFYSRYGKKIFKSLNPLGGWIFRKYGGRNLVDALKDCFGDKVLGDCQKRLVIPAYNLTKDSIYLFKTRHHASLNMDHKLPIWKVAASTAAAPTFFPAFKQVNSMRLVDGGVWANNPSIIGIAEAYHLLNIDIKDIRLLSIGTTAAVRLRPKGLDHGGKARWMFHVIEVLMQGQSEGANKQAAFLLAEDNYFRVNPLVPPGFCKLDKSDPTDLIALASNDSRAIQKDYCSKFMSHLAQPFTPIP